MIVNPIAQALLKTPAELGADYVVGDGQPLGCGMNYGGPALGFIATGKRALARLPGRIRGPFRRTPRACCAFVLTLQAREQHIRRDKASSNICSNQALNALAVNMYLSYVGGEGLVKIARRCHALACFAEDELARRGIPACWCALFQRIRHRAPKSAGSERCAVFRGRHRRPVHPRRHAAGLHRKAHRSGNRAPCAPDSGGRPMSKLILKRAIPAPTGLPSPHARRYAHTGRCLRGARQFLEDRWSPSTSWTFKAPSAWTTACILWGAAP